MRPDVVIETTMVFSTAHIKESTNKMLEEHKDNHEDMPFRYVEHHFGWIFFLSHAELSPLALDKWNAPELCSLLIHAQKRKCAYLNLDRDAAEIGSFETYDW